VAHRTVTTGSESTRARAHRDHFVDRELITACREFDANHHQQRVVIISPFQHIYFVTCFHLFRLTSDFAKVSKTCPKMAGKKRENASDTIMEESSEQSTVYEPLLRERSNPIAKGELCSLVAGADIGAIRALQKSAGAVAIKTELFSRDNLQQTPLSLALKRGDKQIVSLLLSLGELMLTG
jgi:hypothetical protein